MLTKHTGITLLLILMIGGWLALLFVESSQPPAKIITATPGLDKVAHFSAFTILGLLVCALSFHLKPQAAISLFSIPLLLVILAGIGEESYQLFVPGRTASAQDLLADISGALFAIFIANRVARLSRACLNCRP